MTTRGGAKKAARRSASPSAPPWLSTKQQRAWRAWIAMNELLHSQLARDLLADSGLSYADYQVLVHLSEANDRRVRMSDLALLLDWSKSRVSHQVSRMEARGLVAREECPSDARGAFAVLTDAGMDEIHSAAPDHVRSVRAHFIDLLDSEQLDQLEGIARRVVDHLRTLPGGPEVLPALCPEEVGDHPPREDFGGRGAPRR